MTKRPYDRNDNDTYVERYSSIMARDVEIHMFKNDSGRVTDAGNIRGDFSVESGRTAQNNVLRFPTAASTGLVKIKNSTLHTLVPMSLVHRYELEEDHLTYRQVVPVFYDSKLDKFVLIMDYRFLRDVSMKELMPEKTEERKWLKIYQDKKQPDIKYLGLLFDSMADLDNACQPKNRDGAENAFSYVLSAYTFYKMSLQGGEKVIIVKFGTHLNESPKLFKSLDRSSLKSGLKTSEFHFEYTVAVRFGKRYYLCDDQGNIQQKTSFHLDKAKEQDGIAMINQMGFAALGFSVDTNHDVFVVAYSDEQLQLIDNLSRKLNDLHKELCEFFRSGIDKDNTLDRPLLRIPKENGGLLPKL